jgi:uncharacterized membrane protein YhaH (DUF805 family)
MRSLPQGNDGPRWSDALVKDIAFIKTHLRYPFSAKVMMPTVIIGIIVGLILRLSFIGMEVRRSHNHNNNIGLFLFVVFIVVVPLTASIVRYYRTLKFIAIPTPYYLAANQQLLQRFLEGQMLVVYRHPEAPEVYQIASRSASPYKDEREIMIFIADDKRILINSHFTNTGFTLAPASRNTKEMAQKLSYYINNSINNSDISAAVESSF